jgi:hypothetical protein
VVGGGCGHWAEIYQASPSRIRCKFGEYSVAVADCAMLERVYENGTVPATEANTDGNPATWTAPGPYGQPQSQPATKTTTASPPLAEPVPVPVPVVTGNPQGNTDCWPSGWSTVFEPSSWVYMPIQCALKWAFVPTASNLQTQPIRDQLDRAGIAPSIAAVSTAVGSLGGAEGGCSGPAVNFDVGPVHQVVTPFAACAAPMSTVASFAYAFVSVVTVIGGALKIISSIGAGFGYGGPPPTWQQGTLF